MRSSRRTKAERVRTREPLSETGHSVSPTVYSSPGLKVVRRRLEMKNAPYVLDVGPPIAANLAALSGFTTRLFILDLLHSPRDGKTENHKLVVRPKEVLKNADSRVSGEFDVVLAWDVFDYLDPTESNGLVRWFEDHTSPGALVFAVFSAIGIVPADPSGFAMVGGDRLERRSTSPSFRPGRTLAPAEVERLLAPFRVIHSFVLQHGAREVVAQQPAGNPAFS